MDFSYTAAQIAENKILKTALSLKPYIESLQKVAQDKNYKKEESFINLPFDENTLRDAFELKRKFDATKPKYIINIGIGGSYLGTKALYDAVYGFFDVIEPDRFPKVIFVDTNDSDFLYKLNTFLETKSPEEILINTVSKSGTTAESLANLEIITKDMTKYLGRMVVTTKEGSPLWIEAKANQVPCLKIPETVSGRYSVFSAVGIFPLALIEIDVINLLEGAMKARKEGLEGDTEKNPAALSAAVTYLYYKKGMHIYNSFIFQSELESLGKWWQQLAAESLGKDNKGVTPTVSVGTTDLHSMIQLYLGGPRDTLFTFVSAKNENYNVRIPPTYETTEDTMHTTLESVKKSYQDKEIPYTEVVLPNVSVKSLGEFMQFRMMETMFLAKLMGVNAFNQPNVEEYKKHQTQGSALNPARI